MDELIEEAERFQSQLIGSDPEQFAATKLDDLSQDLLFIQSQRDATKEMMSMNRLQLFMDYMTDFEDTLVDLGFQEAKHVMSCVWGSVRYLLKRTNPTEKAFDNILDTYELLGVSLIKVSDYTNFFRDVPAAREYLVNIYKDVQRFHSLAYKLFFTFRAKLWQKLHKPIWKDHRTTFNHIAESLSLHASKIQGYGKPFRDPESNRTGAHERRTDSGIDPNPALNHRQVNEDISNYHVALNKLREEFEETEKKRKREMKISTIAWISSSTKIEKLQDDFRKMRICKNTGRWLFRRNRGVSEWLTAEGGNEGSLSQSAIWLHGNRGFGKTILTSLIIDELADLRQREDQPVPQNSKTYYFYCQEEDPELRTYLEILKGILCQMVNQDDYIVPLCHDKMTQGGYTSLSDADTAKSLIETIVQYNPRQYIIIDGLDECEAAEIRQTAEFFTKLVELCDNANEHGQLRLMIMSRDVPEIKKYMTDDDAIIALRPTDNAEDIKAYVRKRLPEFSESDDDMGFNLSKQLEDSIESQICRRSEDSFLYAHLAIESLLQHDTKGDLLEEIKKDILPEELGTMYEMLLGNLEKKIKKQRGGARAWKKSKLLLGWLVCAKRPLKWHEMQAILSFDAEKEKVDFDNRMLKNDVRRYLGSIVHVLDGDHIRLIHTTARRHIVSNKYIDEKKVQCELTSLCLRYLSLPCFTKTYASTLRRDQARAGWFSFQDYACSKWDSHIDTFIRECSSLFDGPVTAWGKEQRDFDGALRLFINTHGEEIRADLHENLDTTHLENFEDTTFSENLRTLWNRIYIHHKSKDEEKNKVGIAQINTSLLDNRAVLEKLAPDDDAFGKRHIKDLYGLHLFKCSRTLCRYFYVGYDSEVARKNHESRHNRPFLCPVSCNSAPIGFSTNKDRDRHVRIYHPELAEGPSMFEALSRRQATGQARFKCHICDKNFTRKINLSGHERSHYGDRPYQCSICDRGFARMNDCRRHEKIHKKDR